MSASIEEMLLGPDVNLGDERWCVDYPKDLAFVRAVFDHFSPNTMFSYVDVHGLLTEQPHLRDMNADCKQMQHSVHVEEDQCYSTLVRRLGLGTVQLGLAYGINNTDGLPSDVLARKILRGAVDAGVEYLDTARL